MEYYKQSYESLDEIKENPEFQRDLVRFFKGSRYNYTKEQMEEKGLNGLFEDYLEHMRYQEANEATALKDLWYVKDPESDENSKASFGRLMSVWDKAETGGGSGWDKTGDYLSAILTSPSTVAGILTAGVGAPLSKLAAKGASKGGQIALRSAVAEYMGKAATAKAAKEGLKTAAIKGAALGGATEGAMAYGHETVLDEAREDVSPDYEYDPVDFWSNVGLQSAFGGVVGGLARTVKVKEQNKAIDQLEKFHDVRVAKEDDAKKLALDAIQRADPETKATLSDSLASLTAVYDQINNTKIKLNPLDPDKVAEGEDLLTELSKPEDGFRNGLSTATLRKVFAAGVEIAEEVKLEKGERITEGLARYIGRENGHEAFRELAEKYNVTSEELGYLVMADLSHAGRTLQRGAQMKRAADKTKGTPSKTAEASTKAVAAQYAELAQTGLVSVEDNVVKNFVRSSSEKPGIGSKIVDGLREIDAARIGFMTSQPATTAANVISSTARMALDVSDRAWENIFNKRNPINGSLSMIKGMTWRAADADLFFEIMHEEAPEAAKRTFRSAAIIEVETGSNSRLAKMTRGFNILNTQSDLVFKRAAMFASLDRQLMDLNDPAIGRNMTEFMAKGVDEGNVIGRLPEGMFDRAKEEALGFTFQRGYENDPSMFGKGANKVINAAKDYPFLVTSVMPFPRYVANQLEFIHDYTPMLGLATHAMIKATGRDMDNYKTGSQRLARQMTGTAMFASAMALRAGQEGKTAPLDFISEPEADEGLIEGLAANDNRVRTVGRVGGPFNTHLVVADAIYRWKNDLPVPEVGQAVFDALEAATGMGFVGYTSGLIGSIRESLNSGEFTDGFKEAAGDFVATFTFPAVVVKDAIEQFNPEKATNPYLRELLMSDDEEPMVELPSLFSKEGMGMMRALRFTYDFDDVQYLQSFDGETDVDLYSPFNPEPVRTLNPALKHITGVNTGAVPTELEKDINYVNLKPWLLYGKHKVKNPALDVIVRRKLSETMPQEWPTFKEEVKYDSLPEDVRKSVIEDYVNDSVKSAETWAEQVFDDVARKNPRAAAGYIRNTYAIERDASKFGFDAAVQQLGGAPSADDYIAEADSIPDELARRQQIMQWSAIYDEAMKERKYLPSELAEPRE